MSPKFTTQRGFIKKIFALIILLGALAAYYFQPWSSHSPSVMTQIFKPEVRVENFRNMKKVFPSRDIAASSKPYSFPKAEQALPTEFSFEASSSKLSDFLARTQTTSLVVIKNGAIASEQYFQGASENSQHTSWSVAKSFLATLVAVALKEGAIKSVDDKAQVYVPELIGKDYGDVSVRNLLQMSSGIQFDETYNNQLSDINKVFYRTFLLGQKVDDVVAGYTKEAPAGTRFKYISADSQVLARVISKAVKMPITQYLERSIWSPLGMESAAFWSIEREGGSEMAYCCLNATSRDYAKLGQLYLNQGQWQGAQLLPSGWVKEATRPSQSFLEPQASELKIRGYQYQWWVPANYDGEYFANGVWGQMIWVSEKHNVVIVKTSVDPNYRANITETFAAMRAISASLR